MEINGVDEALNIAETIGPFFNGLNFVVEPFGDGVARPQRAERNDAREVSVETSGYRDDRSQTAVRGPEVPVLEKLAGIGRISVMPNMAERFLNGVGAHRLEIILAQLLEAQLALGRQIFGMIQ